MKVAVIGAGIGGLLATKHSKAANFDVTCYEQTASIGGTWVYEDEAGEQIHSAMYKNLRTNFPKELMGFKDYPFTGPENSFVSWKEVLNFLHRFVSDFKLKENILFNHRVKRVKPMSDGKWGILTENLKTFTINTDIYDAVFICNGHHWVPNNPNIKGLDNFKGKIMHSYHYRRPQVFKNENVLVIGCGPSGSDMTSDVATKAKHVYLSHHSEKNFTDVYPSNVSIKPDVAEVTKTGTIKFIDDSEVSIDSILLCTGYNYSFPFLTPECGIKVHENHVQKLFKHLINIENPTMFFIGIVFPTVITYLMDLQVRFSIKLLQNTVLLPSKEVMLKDYDEDFQQRTDENVPNKKMHQLPFEKMINYFKALETMGDLEPTPPVIFKLTKRIYDLIEKDYGNLRNYSFKIINTETYVEALQ